MNKYSLLMIMFVFLIIVTLVAKDIELATTENLLAVSMDSSGASIGSVFSMLGVLFRVLTFQIPAIPLIINVVVFYPLTIGVLAMIIDVVKDLIPFT